MKNCIKYFGLALVFVCLGQAGTAQSQDTLKLDFQTSVEMALQKNIDYRTQQNELSRVEASRNQALFRLGPTLSLNADLFKRDGFQNISNPETKAIDFKDGVTDNLNAGLNSSIVLFNGFSGITGVISSVHRLESQQENLKRSKQTAIFNVTQQYMQALLSHELYIIARDNHRNQVENLKRIEGQTEVNARPIVDKYNQQAAVSRFESLMIQAVNTYENDKATLAQTIQLAPGTRFSLITNLGSLDEMLFTELDINDLYSKALSGRPDFKYQTKNAQYLRLGVYSAKGAYSPTISAFFQYSSFYNNGIGNSFKEQFNIYFPQKYYGFSINIPILNGMSTKNSVTNATLNAANAKLQEENIKSTIYRDVQQAYNNFIASKANYKAALSQLEAANMAYTLQSERYELGAGTFIDFSQANNTLVQAQAAKAQAEFSLKFQRIILDYQTGIISSEGLE